MNTASRVHNTEAEICALHSLASALKNTYDTILSNPLPPRIDEGIYFFAGNQQSALQNLNTFPTFYQQQCALNQNQPVPLNEASILIVGNKTHQGNDCCYMLTFLFAVCLLFPFFFMCCNKTLGEDHMTLKFRIIRCKNAKMTR